VGCRRTGHVRAGPRSLADDLRFTAALPTPPNSPRALTLHAKQVVEPPLRGSSERVQGPNAKGSP
jgi:hypothetical protein